MAGESVVFHAATRSLCDEAERAAGISWMDYQVKLQNTFLHVVQPLQGSRPQRSSSAPAGTRRSESEEVAVGHSTAKPTELGEMQILSSQGTSAGEAGAAGMKPQDNDYGDAHTRFNYDTPTTSEAGAASIFAEADVASFSIGLDDSSSRSGSSAERPSGGLSWGTASMELTPVKQLELIEVHGRTPWSASTGWADDSDQSDNMTDGASFGMESTYSGDSFFADVDYAGPINSTKDFETLRFVPKCNLSPSRFPARVPDGAATSSMASNHGGNMFLNTGYYFGSRTDVVMQDSARSRVMAPVRPVTSRFTSGHFSPPLGAAAVSTQTQPCSGSSANPQDDFTEEKLSGAWSVGTALHSIGKCRPCTFAWKEGGCTQGTACKFCHVWHELKRVQRPCKTKRLNYRKLLEKMTVAMEGGADAQADPRFAK